MTLYRKKVLTNEVYCYKLNLVDKYKPGFRVAAEAKMEERRLCESDYRFMQVIWDNEPVGSMQLVKLCCERLGWKKSTVFTMIRKLSERGLIKNEESVVTSLVKKNEVQKKESDLFIEQTFGGSLPGFLVSFFSGRTLSEKEAEELKRLIDEHKE